MIVTIYKIRNTITNECYVGSTVRSLEERKSQHLAGLRRNTHHSAPLQRAFNRYGESAFECCPVAECAVEDRFQQETNWIKELKSVYNVAPVAGTVLGLHWVLSPETRAKMVIAARLRNESEEYHAKLRVARAKQVLVTPRRLSKMNLPGWKQTEEAKKKISEAGIRRGKRPEYVKEKIRAAHLGKKFSTEHRQRISAAAKLRQVDPAKMRKLADRNIGRKHSQEEKDRRAASVRLAHQRDPSIRERQSIGIKAAWARRLSKKSELDR